MMETAVLESRDGVASLLCAVSAGDPLDPVVASVLDALPQGVVVVASDGEVVFTNRSARVLSGLGVGGSRDLWVDVWDGGGLAGHLPAETAFVRRAARGESFDEELSYFRDPRSGAARWLAGTGRPLRDPTGRRVGGVLVLEEVTERFRAGRALAASEARFQQIADHVDDGFWILGELGERLVYANPALARILGRSSDALRSDVEPWIASVHPEDRSALRAARRQLFAGGEGFDEMYRFLRPDGTTRWLRDRATPVRDPWGDVHEVVGAVTDVTALQEAQAQIVARKEALERSNAALEHFASAVSHDLRQPARMVASYTEILLDTLPELDEVPREALEHARDGALRMGRMVHALLDFSRVRSTEREMQSVDVLRVVDRVLRDLAAHLEEHEAEVEISPPLPVVMGHPELLERLLANLISNAAKFRGAAPPRVGIFGRETEHDWQISVRDEGVGIPEREQSQIFRPFVRLHVERPGEGMGLAIAQRVAEIHRGRLELRSTPGRGSCFTFVLPKAMS